ncbi:MAG TPA: putative toxin-antitoxin system toxin component, PIN family [Anaerolineae bacterium]|nr:putative toxin-antitoxin system toxin component, PIN family [Anaerolineae bacterium]HQH37803.1 putative toxin-antitoxin system toxin component, PIN family [Anaerolineae bacterium]
MPSAVIDLTEMVRMAMQRPEHSRLFQAWEKQAFIWITSESLLDEFIEVTDRPKFRRLIRPLVRDAIVEALRARACIVEPALELPHCHDPKDDNVIAAAIAARPCYLVTADRDLYDDADLVATLRDLEVCVVQVGEFLDVL